MRIPLLLTPFLLAGSGIANAAPEPLAEVELAGEVVEIPITVAGSSLRCEVLIDGHGPYSYVIDTAASTQLLVPPGLVAELGLRKVGEMQVLDGASGVARPADLVAVDTLELGGGAMLYDLRAVSMRAEGAPAAGRASEAGILGFGAFAELLVTIDIPGKRLLLQRGALRPDAGHVVSCQYASGPLPNVEIAVGDRKLRADLDTGNMGGFAIPESLLGELETSGEPRVIGRGMSMNAQFEIRAVPLVHPLRFAGHEVPPVEAQVLPGLLNPNLGFQILSRYVLTFDQAQGLVHFGLPGGAGPSLVESIAPEDRK